jgi:hypothetical protein
METTIALVAFVVGFSVTFGLLTFWVIPRFIRSDPIIPRRKKKPVETPPTKEAPALKAEYLDAIKWRGEVYCRVCGSTLQRMPWQKEWYSIPGFDPMTGTRLSDIERYGNAALMACQKYEEDRVSPTRPAYSVFEYRPKAFQYYFEEREIPDHSMYYTNTPPLTKAS